MNTTVTVFHDQAGLLAYTNKKGDALSITPEGALFKGGKELSFKVRDAACQSALAKAQNGRFRAAADILGAAYPAAVRSAQDCTVGELWANKKSFGALMCSVEKRSTKQAADGKKCTTKQVEALGLLAALSLLPAFKAEDKPSEVIENAAEQTA